MHCVCLSREPSPPFWGEGPWDDVVPKSVTQKPARVHWYLADCLRWNQTVSLKDGDTSIAWLNWGVTLKHISFQSNKVQCTVLYLKFLTMKTFIFKLFFSFFDFCLVYVFNDSEAYYKRRSGPTGYSECARVCWSCCRFQNRCHCTFTAQGTWNKCISLLPVLALVKSFNPWVDEQEYILCGCPRNCIWWAPFFLTFMLH